jgi:negative regulator of flagellin synthesis FlgM
MKIGNSADKPVNGTSGASPSESVGMAASRPAGKTSADDLNVQASAKVSLSPMADDMAHGSAGSFDAAKVASVKNAIANGTFKVNAEAIADKLIANARELLTPRQS